MTFITGSVTNANPGPTLYALIETAMLADGWTLADTVVIGGNTHKVLKSAAAGNVQALDWYLDINYPTTGITGGIRFAPFEGYNATTHVGTNGPYVANSTTIDATTYSRFGSTGSALETNWANTASTTGLSHVLTTSAFTYWISVTRNRIIVMLSATPGGILYSGFFTPYSAFASNAGAASFPLITASLSTGSTTSYPNNPSFAGPFSGGAAILTRLPKVATLLSSGWQYHCAVNLTYLSGGNPEGQIGTAASPFTARSTGLPLVVSASPAGTATGITNASIATPGIDNIGTIDDVIYTYVAATSVRGDTITIGSDTWYDCTPNGVTTLFFRGI